MKKSNTVDSKTKLNNDIINQKDDQEFYFALDKESAQSENTLNNSINDVFLDALDEEVDTISLAESYEKLKIEALNNFYNKELKELRAQPRKENDAEINEKANFENSIFSHLADQWLQESNKNNIQWITDSFYSKFTEYSISGPLKTFAYVGGGAAIGLIGGYGVGMLCGSSTAMTTISSLSFATASGTVSGTVGAVLDKDIKSTLDPVIKDIGIENVITNLSQESNPGEVMLDIAKTIVYDTVLGSTAGSINSGSQVGIIAGGGSSLFK